MSETSGPGVPGSFNSVVEVGLKVVFIFGSLTYGSGFLIWNLTLADYGVQGVALVRGDYMLSGSLWALLTLVSSLSLYISWLYFAKRARREWSRGEHADASVTVFFALIISFLPLWLLLSHVFSDGLWWRDRWMAFFGVLLPSGIIVQTAYTASRMWLASRYGAADEKTRVYRDPPMMYWRWQLLQYATFQVSALVLGIIVYTNSTYPRIDAAFGGGHREAINLVINAVGEDAAMRLGLPFAAVGEVGPVTPLTFDSDFFYFLAAKEGHAYALKRDTIIGTRKARDAVRFE